MSSLEDEGYQDLKKRTATSVIWSVARVLWSTGTSFVIFVVLARLLGPADFGLFALAALFVDISRIIAGGGLGNAVIRQSELSEELADTAFWANVTLSLMVALAVFGLAPLYGDMVNNPQVADILRALAFTLPVAALSGIHGARLTRDYKHKLFAVQTAISSVVSGIAGIIAALNGFGVWSLVVQAWVGAILSVGMAWFALPWIPKLRFSMSAFKSIIVFSLSMTFNQVLWLLIGRVGDIIIARSFGTEQLGRYRIAWRIYELVGQLALSPIGSVAMLTFAKLQNEPERLRAAYYRILSLASLIAFPLMMGYAALSNEIVALIFSDKWQGVGQISSILAFMIIPFVVNYITPSLLAAKNKSLEITIGGLLGLTSVIVFTLIAVPYGLIAVAIAFVVRSYVVFPYSQWVLNRTSGVRFVKMLEAIRLPLLLSGVMALCVAALRPVVMNLTGDNEIATVATGVMVGGIIYVSGLYIFGRKSLKPTLESLNPKLVKLLRL